MGNHKYSVAKKNTCLYFIVWDYLSFGQGALLIWTAFDHMSRGWKSVGLSRLALSGNDWMTQLCSACLSSRKD